MDDPPANGPPWANRGGAEGKIIFYPSLSPKVDSFICRLMKNPECGTNTVMDKEILGK